MMPPCEVGQRPGGGMSGEDHAASLILLSDELTRFNWFIRAYLLRRSYSSWCARLVASSRSTANEHVETHADDPWVNVGGGFDSVERPSNPLFDEYSSP